jgi:hypothetical protein
MTRSFNYNENEAEKRQRISRENRRKGKVTEELIQQRYGLNGYDVKRTGSGSDYHAIKRDVLGNIIEDKLIEVKYGNSQLSDLQKKTLKANKGHYEVERIPRLPNAFWQDP